MRMKRETNDVLMRKIKERQHRMKMSNTKDKKKEKEKETREGEELSDCK